MFWYDSQKILLMLPNAGRLKADSVFTIVWHFLDLYLCVSSCHITMPFFLHLYVYEACPLLWAEQRQTLLLQLVSSLWLSPVDQNHSVQYSASGCGPFLTGTKAPSLCGPEAMPTS